MKALILGAGVIGTSTALIGPRKIPNLYLDTGHGTLGWTMARGSGRALADIISGRKPEIPFPFTRWKRQRWSS